MTATPANDPNLFMSMTPRHAQARQLAAAGIKVFPCEVGGKRPATRHGFKDASAVPEQIDAWWNVADYNIGLCPEDAGWAVVDIDPGGETPWLEALTANGGYEKTCTVQTPRGGQHIYFKGSLPSTASKLAPHVDTRGVGGYVLVPPSVVNGKPYRALNDHDPAELPAWISTLLAAKVSKVEGEDAEADTDVAVSRAQSYLRRLVEQGDVAVEGQGGDNRTFRLFAQLKSIGLSQEKALELVASPDGWNDRCSPPWLPDDLAIKAEHGYRYAQNPIGSDTDTRPAVEVFGKSEAFRAAMDASKLLANDNAPAGASPSTSRVDFYRGWPPSRGASRPPIVFLDPQENLLPLTNEGSVVLWYGLRSALKTTTAVCTLMAAIKRHVDDPENAPAIRVAYGIGEGVHGFDVGQVPAAADHYDIPLAVLDKYWRTVPVPPLTSAAEVDAFTTALADLFDGEPPTVVTIDTLATAAQGVDENSAEIGGLLLSTGPVGRIKERLGGPLVMILDHAGKEAGRGVRGHSSKEGNADAIVRFDFDKATRRLVGTVEKMRGAEDGFEIEYRVTPPGQVPVIVPIGRVDAQQATARKQATSLARTVLICLSWFSEWSDGKRCEVTTGELATALMRAKAWTDPVSPGAAAPEIVLQASLTAEEAAARKNLQHDLARLARQWRKKPEYAGIVAQPATSSEWTFKAHAAARLLESLANRTGRA